MMSTVYNHCHPSRRAEWWNCVARVLSSKGRSDLAQDVDLLHVPDGMDNPAMLANRIIAQ